MAYETKDGKKFGSAYVAKRYESYHGEPQPGEVNDNEHAEPKNLSGDMDHPHTVIYSHDHDNGNHKVTKHYPDGSSTESNHSSAAEAYEAGGEKQATNVKREDHPHQQGAKSEEENWEMPDLT